MKREGSERERRGDTGVGEKLTHHSVFSKETADQTTVHHTHHHRHRSSMNFDLPGLQHNHHLTTVTFSAPAHKDLTSSSPSPLPLLLLLAYSIHSVAGPWPSCCSCCHCDLVSCSSLLLHKLSSVRELVHGNHGSLLESCSTHHLSLLHYSDEGSQHHCLLRNVCQCGNA